MGQLNLLRVQTVPEGFQYLPEILTPDEEERLLQRFADLPFQAFEFRGFEGKRRVVSYGWRYDFSKQKVETADPIPDFLLPVREVGSRFAGLDTEALEQVSVIEYSPGSAIGWHKDRPQFGDVVGVSLASACRFRFRRQKSGKWERVNLTVDPRSMYLLRGPSREEWQHSIPGVATLRYSITMRTFRRSHEGA
jgi:alkylated DNA repair dioxygenase AlkB